jgi:hypothetical protein
MTRQDIITEMDTVIALADSSIPDPLEYEAPMVRMLLHRLAVAVKALAKKVETVQAMQGTFELPQGSLPHFSLEPSDTDNGC